MESGRKQFREWIERRFKGSSRPQRDAVELLAIPGGDEHWLSKILNTDRMPEPERLAIIEEKTGIPMRAWVASQLDESELVAARNPRKRK